MKKETRILDAGRRPVLSEGAVNPPVWRASTVLHPTLAALEHAIHTPFEGLRYGRFGTPTVYALEEAIAEIEGGARTIATCSGLAAITGTLTALLQAGDHLLVTDAVYQPTRTFCDTVLARLGITTTYFDPVLGPEGLRALLGPATRLVFLESPGSLTFEMSDIPALTAAAHGADALVAIDNTWGVLSFQPFRHGVDISIQACTKYIVGHADAMLGAVTVSDLDLWHRLKTGFAAFGACPGSEEAALGLRGLRTLAVRLARHGETAKRLTEWLAARPEVARVLYPAHPGDPGFDLWRRDFSGACGLFGVILKPVERPGLEAMLNGFRHFKLGFSWGGFESLVIPAWGGAVKRTATRWTPEGPALRFHAGLEAADDLIADLEDGFSRLSSLDINGPA